VIGLICVPFAGAQTASAPTQKAIRKDKAPIPVIGTPAAPAALPAASVAQPSIEPAVEEQPQTPPRPPAVAWDGKLLTVDAENSTLSDILVLIRTRTGASIDMPPSTMRERVFVHLGPAPAREVLSSLLYGTDFDYVIQALDGDEDGLRSVVLSARGKPDDATPDVTGEAAGMRLMPGYAAPGKRTFEVSHAAAADPDAAASAPADSATSAEAAPAAKDPAAGADPAAEGAQASAGAGGADPQAAPTSASDSADISPAGGSSGNIPLSKPTSSASNESGAGEAPSVSQMVQDLQRMYQQRRQIQAQQNQTAGTAPASN
jgi:hypothetical protein